MCGSVGCQLVHSERVVRPFTRICPTSKRHRSRCQGRYSAAIPIVMVKGGVSKSMWTKVEGGFWVGKGKVFNVSFKINMN